jgi:hypothetical protein
LGVRACVGFMGAWWLAMSAGGCGPPPPPPVEAPKPVVDEGPRPVAVSAESEIGGMSETGVTQTFQRVSPGLMGCYEKGQTRIPFLAGEVHFVVRVAKDGSTRWAYVKDSNLGDRETEVCMVGVLKATSWPKPVGGEGLVEGPVTFDPSGDEKPPVAWQPDQLGPALRNAKGALGKCRKKAGAKAMKATMYVDTAGKAYAVGVSSADEKGDAAADCVIDALQRLKFRSPGSYAAKVSVSIE